MSGLNIFYTLPIDIAEDLATIEDLARTKKTVDIHRDMRARIICRLYAMGWSAPKIAEELKTNTQTIWAEVSAIKAAWRSAALADIHFERNRDLERIEALIRESQIAWVKSQDGDEKILDDGTRVQGAKRAGDPRHLAVIAKLLERRAKIIGYDAPEQKDINHNHQGQIGFAHLSDDDLEQCNAELVALVAAAKSAGATGEAISSTAGNTKTPSKH